MASKELTVILKAKDLAKHTLEKTSNCNHYPKKFRFSLVDKMQNKSLEIYECLIEANRTDIKAYKRERLELQTRAITHCDELLYYIELSNSLGLINIKCVDSLVVNESLVKTLMNESGRNPKMIANFREKAIDLMEL